jgi:hypothetical protein
MPADTPKARSGRLSSLSYPLYPYGQCGICYVKVSMCGGAARVVIKTGQSPVGSE